MIETERLILRPFRLSDAADLLEYLAEPAVNCFADMKINSLQEAQATIASRIKAETEEFFAVCLKESGKVIGEIFDCPEESEQDTFTPCWMLNTAFQGHGYAYEAISAYFDYLFSEKNARRIYIYTEDYNIACQKLCENLCMRKEGLFLEFISFVKIPTARPNTKIRINTQY